MDSKGLAISALICSLITAGAWAQQTPGIGIPIPPLGSGPFVFDTAEQHKIRVSVVARGIPHPFALAFLPNGDMLVSERAGNLRLIRDGRLLPDPVKGLPAIRAFRSAGLLDLAADPKFTENQRLYFTYSKPGPQGTDTATVLARAKFNGTELTNVEDLLIGAFAASTSGARIAFGRDGMVYMTTGAPFDGNSQEPGSLYGKILRVTMDGKAPADNPFVGKAGYRPEIYTLGHRDQLGLAIHPETGAVLAVEHGPNGGDEVNLILPGRNYGWPVLSYGRTYEGPRVSETPWKEGFEQPLLLWIPSIAPSGLVVYSGDRFAAWKGNLFVGGNRYGEIPGTGRLERVVFNAKMEELRRESLLTDLHQRIRDVRQGPDGLLYVITDEQDGAVLRIQPAN